MPIAFVCASPVFICWGGGQGDQLEERKRISLEEVEGRLRALPWVREVAVLPLNVATRQQLGAVLVLTEAGTDPVAGAGARSFPSSPCRSS